MNISRGQWLLAVVAAAVLHLCLLGLFLLGGLPHHPPDDSPRGVMVSLDALDPGPAPRSTAESAPIEAAGPDTEVPSAPTPVEASSPSSTGTTDVKAPEAAADIGPQPAESAIASASQAAEPVTPAPEQAGASAASAAQVASAVTIRPNDVNESIAPQEQVTARNADPGALTSNNAPNDSNGAYGSSEQATDDYIVRLRAWLSRHKQYPIAARNEQVEGTVRLYLVIDANGNVVNQRIIQSSGSRLLDDAAKQMLARSEPLPPMSTSMQRNRLELIVPVVFSLR